MPLIDSAIQLQDRIYFQKNKKVGTGPNGIPIYDWETIFSCWAYGKTRTIKEILSDSTVYKDTVSLVIRHEMSKEIKADMRVEWNSEQYEIEKINPDISEKAYDVLFIKKVK